MKAFLYLNLTKPHYIETAKSIINELIKGDAELILSPEDKEYFSINNDYTIKDADMIVSIGGDGTLLKASKLALEYDLPILGINAGRVGYLCKYHLIDVIEKKIDLFKYDSLSLRNVIYAEYNNKEFIALNDFVFASRNAGYTVKAHVEVGNQKINYHGSGVIIATPTGSSAYNKAACSCVLSPDIECNIISPICPCGEEKNSYVINNTKDIKVSNARIEDPIDVYADGKYVGELKEELIIKKYSKQLKLIV